MSFIGSGELEHKITQLQRQLDHKDHELNSMKNEQRKREEELVAAQRAKEAAEYKLQDEANRAHQAETVSNGKATEISQLRLKLSNLESTLTQTSDKLKKEEKEKDRIQDSLDAALSSGSDGAAKQVREQQARVKQLEEQLKRAEEERERLRSQGSSTDAWGSSESLSRGERNKLMAMQNEVQSLRDENAKLKTGSSSKASAASDLFGASSSSPVQSRSKRRSLSVSAANEVRELEVQIDSLKEQLVHVRKDLDKAVNEKLAVEISGKKRSEKLVSEMDEMRNELDYYKSASADGGVDKKEVDKIKKAALAESEGVRQKLQEAEAEVQKKQKEAVRLEARAEEVETLQAELEKERQLRLDLQSTTSASQPDSAHDESLDKIASLEAELAKARSATSNAASKTNDGDLRQVRRELQKALRDKDYLDSLVKENDELLAEKDEEITRLKTAIPIPGSPTLSPKADDELLATLEEEKTELAAQIERQAAEYRSELESIEKDLEDVTRQLQTVRKAEQGAAMQIEKQTAELQTLAAQHTASSSDLEGALQTLTQKDEQLQQLTADLTQLRSAFTDAEAAALSARSDVSSLNEKLEAASASLADKEQVFGDVISRRDELERLLATRSHDDADFEQLSLSIKSTQEEVIAANQKAADDLAELNELVSKAREEAASAQTELDGLRQKFEDAESRAQKADKLAKEAVDEKDSAINAMSEQLVDLKADLSALQIQLDDKIAELASTTAAAEEVHNSFEQAVQSNNDLQARLTELEAAQADRSTDSEARDRDEQLFQLQEEKRNLETSLAAVKAEFAEETSSITFKAEQDVKAAQQKVADVEARVVGLQKAVEFAKTVSAKTTISAVDEKEVQKLEEKIARLRLERDDLRHKVSFVQNERHFALRAANADRESALEDMKRAREELKHKALACDKLQTEVQSVRESLERMSDRPDASNDPSVEEQNLAEKIAQLESNLSEAKAEVDTHLTKITKLETDLSVAELRCGALQNEVSNLIHHVGANARLSDPPTGTAPAAEEDDDLPADLPVVVAESQNRPRPSHTRSRSSVSTTMLQNLTMERNLQAKISRREGTLIVDQYIRSADEWMARVDKITSLSNELNKAKANLALAQDAQEEVLAENADLNKQCNRLKARVQADTSVEPDISTLREFVLALAVHHQEAKGATARWREARFAVRSSHAEVSRLNGELSVAAEETAAVRQSATEAEAEKAQLQAILDSARHEEASARYELQQLQGTLANLQTRLSAAEDVQADVADSTEALNSVEARLIEKEEKIADLQAQIEGLVGQLAEAQNSATAATVTKDEEIATLSARVASLQEQVGEERARLSSVQAEKQGLEEEIQAAERALAEGMADADAQKEKLADQQKETERQLAIAEQGIESKAAQLSEVQAKIAQLEKQVEEEKARTAEIICASENDLTTIAHLKAEITQLRKTSEVVEAEKAALLSDVEELRSVSATADEQVILFNEKMAEEREKAQQAIQTAKDVTERLELAEQVLQEKEIAVAELKNELESAVRGAAQLAEESQGKQAQVEELSQELAGVKNKLDASHVKLDSMLSASEAKQAVVDDLHKQNEQLKVELAQSISSSAAPAPGAAVNDDLVTDLKERIEQLESSLTQKTQEVDEADDQTREAFKANAKLTKKIGKLQRQIEGLQVDLNTVKNKAVSVQPVAAPETARTFMAPPPVPTPTHAAAPVTTASASASAVQRTPSQSMNIFNPKSTPSSTVKAAAASPSAAGMKRHREGDDLVPRAVDAIMLPPTTHAPSPSARRPLGAKTSFTPQRSVNAFAPKENARPIDLGLGHGLGVKTEMKNVFARPTPEDVVVKASPFPLPPTRNVFHTAPRN